ncbi:uncharacterized protein EURHEDRAFT_118504 [Aspergillus ruber CBS 135680]|uniref:Uncharacterized protein n=1 Tax=Aspergillus ruber (strain CBS 135680) TaxID=1388766 RepID=A0A017SRI3_ASPRC|nr:uncharacterized protein EURHEDRAFT_118504 [Aspergillus ruber CBS 135680]EYE98900.1 hypothetical protein EURHEDRAFT_118504 [Aspergillus ruber CBS 135680]
MSAQLQRHREKATTELDDLLHISPSQLQLSLSDTIKPTDKLIPEEFSIHSQPNSRKYAETRFIAQNSISLLFTSGRCRICSDSGYEFPAVHDRFVDLRCSSPMSFEFVVWDRHRQNSKKSKPNFRLGLGRNLQPSAGFGLRPSTQTQSWGSKVGFGSPKSGTKNTKTSKLVAA